MPSKFYRPPTEVPIQEIDTAESVRRVNLLNIIQTMITNGMCVSAATLARDHQVQFKPETLRAWTRDPHQGPYYDHRKVYAWVVRQDEPKTLTLSTRRHMRRFVRSSSKVA
jgi:hypothetical protein